MEREEGYTSTVQFTRFETLKYIQEGLSVSEIARVRKTTRRAVYKVLSTLIKKGLIRNPKRSIYELTNEGIKGIHSFVALRYNLRQHNLHIKIKVLESPKNWELKRNELRQLPYFNKTLKLKNNEQDLFNYGKIQVKTTSQSVIIKLPTLYSKDWEGALIQAMSILEDTIAKVEHQFKIILVKDYKANITFITQEYAILQDALAKTYRHEGNRLYLTGEDNKIWLITDFSFSIDETEFIHPNKATDDIDAIAPFLNDLRKNPTTISEMKSLIGEVMQTNIYQAQNIIKHQAVLDSILTSNRELKAIVNELRNTLREKNDKST